MTLTATQTGAGWDVDETTGGTPVIARDGNGRSVGLVDPVTGESVWSPESLPIVSASVRCRLPVGAGAVGANNVTNTRFFEKTNVAGTGPMVEYWNGYVDAATQNAPQEKGVGSVTPLRMAILTNPVGVGLNQTGATLTPLTWFNAALGISGYAWKLDGTQGTAAEFVAAGGTISNDGYTIGVPDGWRVMSDAAASVTLRAGDRYAIQTEENKAQGLLRPSGTGYQKTTLGDAVQLQATTGTKVFSLDWTGAAQGNGSSVGGPVNVWMTGLSGQKVVGIAGDSIITETGDFAVGTTVIEGDGDGCLAFANRALNAAGYSWVRTAIPGTRATLLYSYGGHAQRLLALRYCSAVISDMGHNDRGMIWAGAAGTGFLETYRWYWNQLRRACLGGKGRVVQTTLAPKPTSTDNWATAANQTDAAGSTQYASTNPFLLSRQFSVASGDPDAVFDLYGAIYSTQGLNVANAVATLGGQAAFTLVTDKMWPANNSAYGGSRDGTHASGPIYAGVAAVMAPQLPALCGF